jgi:fused signal recognition particle receptor
MAFGFIKKVFSFGRKEVVEEKPDETAPLPPLNLEALSPPPEPIAAEPTKPGAAPVPVPEVEPARPPEEPKPAEPAPEPPAPESPPGESLPEELPADEAPAEEPEPAPQEVATPPTEPEPEEIPVPAPAEPEIAPPPPEKVPAEPVQPEPQPIPPEIPSSPVPPTPEIPPAPPEPSSELREEGGETRAEPDENAELPSPVAPPGITEPKVEAKGGKVTVARKVEQKAEPQKAPEPAVPKRSWFQRMREGLARSSRELSGNIAGVFTRRKLDEDTLQDLEDVLIRADLGVETALRVTDSLAASRYGKDVSDAEVRAVMAQEVEKVLAPVALPLELDLSHKPHVVLVVGVNGTGKTTTIGKLAAKLTEGGLSVMLAAGDTFRAAAIEQLKIWGERTGSPVVATKLGADAAGLAYDAFEKAKEAGSDVLIIDTAGRLQNKAELMAELEKIVRVLGKLDPEAPHTVLQTVDATTGQNALNQVEIFRNVAGVNGLVMTKLDGTARGGILVAIAAKHKLPVYFIGVGEQVDDLEPFSAGDFAKAIAGVE